MCTAEHRLNPTPQREEVGLSTTLHHPMPRLLLPLVSLPQLERCRHEIGEQGGWEVAGGQHKGEGNAQCSREACQVK